MATLNVYLDKRNVDFDLKMKVRKYFEYLNKQSNEDDEQGSDMIQKNLAKSLKEEILKDTYGRILRQKKLFHLIFSDEFLEELALTMKEKVTGPVLLFKFKIFMIFLGRNNI